MAVSAGSRLYLSRIIWKNAGSGFFLPTSLERMLPSSRVSSPSSVSSGRVNRAWALESKYTFLPCRWRYSSIPSTPGKSFSRRMDSSRKVRAKSATPRSSTAAPVSSKKLRNTSARSTSGSAPSGSRARSCDSCRAISFWYRSFSSWGLLSTPCIPKRRLTFFQKAGDSSLVWMSTRVP